MNKRFIFIIATEHHLIQFKRAISHFHIDANYITLIIFKNDTITRWIDELRCEFTNIEIECFDNWVFRHLFFDRAKVKKFNSYIQKLRLLYPNIFLFLSQYSNDCSLLAVNILKPKEIYIMDEGTASFIVADKRRIKKDKDFKLMIKSFLYAEKLSVPKSIIYFTQYHIPLTRKDDKLVKYSFDKIDNKLNLDKESVILLGTGLSDLDLISETTYLKIIEIIKKEFAGKRLYYYAHRKEDQGKLLKIKMMGLVVVTNKKPFEFLFPELFDNMPSVICSFSSPILDTLSKQYKQIPKFCMYRISPDLYKKKSTIESMLFKSFSQNNSLEIKELGRYG